MNAHLERPYASDDEPIELPVSEAAQRSGIILPLIPSMTSNQITTVCDHLASALAVTMSAAATA